MALLNEYREGICDHCDRRGECYYTHDPLSKYQYDLTWWCVFCYRDQMTKWALSLLKVGKE